MSILRITDFPIMAMRSEVPLSTASVISQLGRDDLTYALCKASCIASEPMIEPGLMEDICHAATDVEVDQAESLYRSIDHLGQFGAFQEITGKAA